MAANRVSSTSRRSCRIVREENSASSSDSCVVHDGDLKPQGSKIKECLKKVAETISVLIQPGESFLLLLTGEVQRERTAEILGLHPCGFRPQHSSKLGNEFRLFTNYDLGTRLGGWKR